MSATPPRLHGLRIRVALAPLAVVLLSTLVLLLVRHNRSLRAELADVRTRATHPRALRFVPPFRAVTLAGDSVTIGERADSGRQLLFFLTTTCQYCRASLPSWRRLATLADSLTVPATQVYGIVLDSSDAAVAQYASAHSLPFPIVRMPSARLTALYRATSVPMTMVVSAEGRVVYARRGVVDNAAVEDSLATAVRWIGAPRQTAPTRP